MIPVGGTSAAAPTAKDDISEEKVGGSKDKKKAKTKNKTKIWKKLVGIRKINPLRIYRLNLTDLNNTLQNRKKENVT